MDLLLIAIAVGALAYFGKLGRVGQSVRGFFFRDRKLTLLLGGLLLLLLVPGLLIQLILPLAAIAGIWYMSRSWR